MLKAGTSVPRPELISSPCIASFVDGEAIQVSPSPACGEMVVEDPLSRVGHTHTHDLMRQKARLCGNPRTWKPENPSQDGDGHSQTHVWVINGPTWATLPYADGLFCSVSAERASRCSPVWEDHGPDMQCNPGGQQSHSNGDPKVWYIYIFLYHIFT